jgi:hypothetical protein
MTYIPPELVHVTLGLHRRIEFLSAAEEEWEISGEDTRRVAINTEIDERCVPQFLGSSFKDAVSVAAEELVCSTGKDMEGRGVKFEGMLTAQP